MNFIQGFGFVTFLAKKDALEAKRRMDREIVDGRRLVVRKIYKKKLLFELDLIFFFFQVNFAKPKQKTSISTKEHSLNNFNW